MKRNLGHFWGAYSGPYCYSAVPNPVGQPAGGGSAQLHPANRAQPAPAPCGVSVRSGALGHHKKSPVQKCLNQKQDLRDNVKA